MFFFKSCETQRSLAKIYIVSHWSWDYGNCGELTKLRITSPLAIATLPFRMSSCETRASRWCWHAWEKALKLVKIAKLGAVETSEAWVEFHGQIFLLLSEILARFIHYQFRSKFFVWPLMMPMPGVWWVAGAGCAEGGQNLAPPQNCETSKF